MLTHASTNRQSKSAVYRYYPPRQFSSLALIANLFVRPGHCGFNNVCCSIRKAWRIHAFNEQGEFGNIRLLGVNKALCLRLILKVSKDMSVPCVHLMISSIFRDSVEFLHPRHSLPEVTEARIEILRYKSWDSWSLLYDVQTGSVLSIAVEFSDVVKRQSITLVFRKQLLSKWNRVAKFLN